mmetsp:Transcript_6534/g.8833  ORF Transcript_6534/g.8833 Transcript_6534/m.8833 type:complete len:213 (-) Transcript_6534:104-742(-)|eukprot:CAMPEP_0185729976 /NCGR_PEP_ID=MMETSP1171-20130828/7908_1 /TAXON_ID=374046 /ORGANISM="Helicotheca tamensis, Strain CCMP826" /LENGTH=212 /DNA_ID=CAMNT_0028398933 /DNA_START=106 /DNA_END=744 /DNA_ORIENTATION=+
MAAVPPPYDQRNNRRPSFSLRDIFSKDKKPENEKMIPHFSISSRSLNTSQGELEDSSSLVINDPELWNEFKVLLKCPHARSSAGTKELLARFIKEKEKNGLLKNKKNDLLRHSSSGPAAFSRASFSRQSNPHALASNNQEGEVAAVNNSKRDQTIRRVSLPTKIDESAALSHRSWELSAVGMLDNSRDLNSVEDAAAIVAAMDCDDDSVDEN